METEYLEDNLRLVEAFEFQEELMAAIEKQNKANVKLPALIPIDLKSLPWTARESEIQEFLGVDTARVMITLNEYRKPSGEARAWVKNEQDADRAVSKNGGKLGQRTVGVKKGINKDLDYNKLIRGQYRLKLSRLPWSVTEEQIKEFLFGSAVIGVSIEKGEDGRPNGDAIVYVNTFACVENAMKFQKQELGNRNIDIACYDDKPRPNPLNPSIQLKLMEEIKREKQSGGSTKSSSTSSQSGSKVLDLLSLPWSATEQDIKSFLTGVGVDKVLIVLNEYRKPSGEARVWVRSSQDAEKALALNGQKLKDRTIAVKAVSAESWSGNGSKRIRMASLPWTVTDEQIVEFFYGSKVESVDILKEGSGRPNGEADVMMKSLADVENALKFHKQLIGSRNVNISQL